jgi:hypothetical protein
MRKFREIPFLEPGQVKLSVLLLTLVLILLIVPMLEAWDTKGLILRTVFSFVVLSSAIATKRGRVQSITSLVVAAIVVPTFWLTMLFRTPLFFVFGCVLDALFLAAMAVFILVGVLKKHLATAESIYGAVAAYLLIGLAWTMVFWAVQTCDPGSLDFLTDIGASDRGEVRAFSEMVYFSFVTMSTLGYGDIVPVSSLARTLTWMLSVTGLFYVAIIVAWLVSELPSRADRRV